MDVKKKQDYMGGNPSEEKSAYLPGIRDWIFQNTTGSTYTNQLSDLG